MTTTTSPRFYEPRGLGAKHPAWLLVIIPALTTCLIVVFLIAFTVGGSLADNHP